MTATVCLLHFHFFVFICLFTCLMSTFVGATTVNFFVPSVKEGSANAIGWHADLPSHKTDVKQFQEVMKEMKSFQGL